MFPHVTSSISQTAAALTQRVDYVECSTRNKLSQEEMSCYKLQLHFIVAVSCPSFN